MQSKEILNTRRLAEFGKVSSGIIHDLINPLTAMSLYLCDLTSSEHKLPPNIRRKLETTLLVSKRMQEFVLSIRRQINQADQKKVFSVNKEITHVFDLLSQKALKEKVSLKFSGTKKVDLYGDHIKFYRVILNLVSNAIDSYSQISSSNKLVEVRLSQYSESREINFLEICVIDSGIGMDENTFRSIFEPFFTTKEENDGSGIGLSTSKDIIEKEFDGDIHVDSTYGFGTTFTVMIPIKNIP